MKNSKESIGLTWSKGKGLTSHKGVSKSLIAANKRLRQEIIDQYEKEKKSESKNISK